MIVAVAIRRNGLIFTMPPPSRHHTVLNVMSKQEKIDALDVEQGFLTSAGKYVDRAEALEIVKASGQPTNPLGFATERELYSEDVW